MKSLPGWTITTDEISNGVFKITLTDAYGHLAEVTGTFDESIEKAKSHAFNLELQLLKTGICFYTHSVYSH